MELPVPRLDQGVKQRRHFVWICVVARHLISHVPIVFFNVEMKIETSQENYSEQTNLTAVVVVVMNVSGVVVVLHVMRLLVQTGKVLRIG